MSKQEELAKVDEAIGALIAGERVVTVAMGDISIQFAQSRLGELQAMRDRLAAEVAEEGLTRRPSRLLRIKTRKGL